MFNNRFLTLCLKVINDLPQKLFLVFLIFFDNKEVEEMCNDDKYSKYALQQGTLSLTNNI